MHKIYNINIYTFYILPIILKKHTSKFYTIYIQQIYVPQHFYLLKTNIIVAMMNQNLLLFFGLKLNMMYCVKLIISKLSLNIIIHFEHDKHNCKFIDYIWSILRT